MDTADFFSTLAEALGGEDDDEAGQQQGAGAVAVAVAVAASGSRMASTSTYTEISGIVCPVCHVELLSVEDLHDHADGAHPELGLKRPGRFNVPPTAGTNPHAQTRTDTLDRLHCEGFLYAGGYYRAPVQHAVVSARFSAGALQGVGKHRDLSNAFRAVRRRQRQEAEKERTSRLWKILVLRKLLYEGPPPDGTYCTAVHTWARRTATLSLRSNFGVLLVRSDGIR